MVSVSTHEGPERVHRAVPTLTTRLVVSLDAPIEVRYDGRTTHDHAVLTGLMRPGVPTSATVLRPQQPTVYVELTASALQRLTWMPPSELDAGGVSADAVLPWLEPLRQELANRPATSAKRCCVGASWSGCRGVAARAARTPSEPLR